MTIKSPPLRVTQARDLIVGTGIGGSTRVTWVEYQELSKLFQVPVTKEFEITLSTEHVPYGIRVYFDRRTGIISSGDHYGSNLIQMKIGWNDFAFRNFIISGHYWMAVQSLPSEFLLQIYSIPVRVEYDAEVLVTATSLEKAKQSVEHKVLSQVYLSDPKPATKTQVRINYIKYEKLVRNHHD